MYASCFSFNGNMIVIILDSYYCLFMLLPAAAAMQFLLPLVAGHDIKDMLLSIMVSMRIFIYI